VKTVSDSDTKLCTLLAYLAVAEGLKERRYAHEADLIVPHDAVNLLSRVARNDEAVLEDCHKSARWFQL
jgi:hypothetical protein